MSPYSIAARKSSLNSSRCSFTQARPSQISSSAATVASQSSRVWVSVRSSDGNSDAVEISSTGRPSSPSIAASAARKGSSTSSGSGPTFRVRGAARTRLGIPPPYCHDGAAVGSPSAGPRITCRSSFTSSMPAASGPWVE